MFFVLGICVLLAAMLLVSSIGSLGVSLIWLACRNQLKSASPVVRARLLFLLRILPVVTAIFVSLVLVAPAFFYYEPRSGYETVSFKLASVAALGLFGLIFATTRVILNWRATSRLLANWSRAATPISLPGVRVPAFEFEHPFPLVGVIGVFRPQLFIAKHVFASLTSHEVAAAIQHEVGHIRARDNLKRAVMRACSDLLWFSPTRSLDRSWIDATESAADDHATRIATNANLDLASALVKIARMVPSGVNPTIPAGAFLISDDGSQGFRLRVKRLIQNKESNHQQGEYSRLLMVCILVSALIAITLALIQPNVFLMAHLAIERLVQLLH